MLTLRGLLVAAAALLLLALLTSPGYHAPAAVIPHATAGAVVLVPAAWVWGKRSPWLFGALLAASLLLGMLLSLPPAGTACLVLLAVSLWPRGR